MSAGGEVAPRRRKGGDDGSWVDPNLTEPKNIESIQLLQMNSEDLKQ
jgi:hypothetical protein